jgi:hypothetical protein
MFLGNKKAAERGLLLRWVVFGAGPTAKAAKIAYGLSSERLLFLTITACRKTSVIHRTGCIFTEAGYTPNGGGLSREELRQSPKPLILKRPNILKFQYDKSLMKRPS